MNWNELSALQIWEALRDAPLIAGPWEEVPRPPWDTAPGSRWVRRTHPVHGSVVAEVSEKGSTWRYEVMQDEGERPSLDAARARCDELLELEEWLLVGGG